MRAAREKVRYIMRDSIDGHPQTDTAYARLHDTGDPENPLRVTVLHIDPALSPAKAVRAFIVQGYDNA
jgi:hypothetical protein